MDVDRERDEMQKPQPRRHPPHSLPAAGTNETVRKRRNSAICQTTALAIDMGDTADMQFFSLQAESAAARAGTLITRRGAISTPTALLYTRRGGCMYLTPDMMDKLRPQAQGIQINAMQL